MPAEEQIRGSIAFFTTYRPPSPLDIFSRPVKTSTRDERHMTDGHSSNYNGRAIPPQSLQSIIENIIKRPNLKSRATVANVDSGLIFVSERDNGLETLHIALRFKNTAAAVEVFSFAEVYSMSSDVRMEDRACFAGDYVFYVSTKENPDERRQPWTVVYKTNLKTGETDRLTPSWQADLSPAASPNGKMIAVASFQRRGGWHGEIEDLQTDIYVMNLEKPFKRRLVIKNGGWPTWGSDRFIFFHRMVIDGYDEKCKIKKHWAVFRSDLDNGEILLVTPENIDAMTPAAIDATRVAVATERVKSESNQYRHIEIFDCSAPWGVIKITEETKLNVGHYNPFVMDGGNRIGYHRGKCEHLKMDEDERPKQFHKVKSAESDIGLFRVSGVFPSFSRDGSKLAFVDNELRTVWLAEMGRKPRIIYQEEEDNVAFSPVWNQNEDILYICKGPSFSPDRVVDICVIFDIAAKVPLVRTLTHEKSNNAFPSSSPDGKRLVFRSTRDGGIERHKNLYIIDAHHGEHMRHKATRLTEGPWTDTQCQWSPTGDWIVFSSTRDKPKVAPQKDNDLDPGYFAVYLVNAYDRSVVIRVIGSGYDLAGHVNHPFFSPDGKSIVVTSDLAAVSADPVSLPFFLHSVRPYGDIFIVHIDIEDIKNNKDMKFDRVTHSRYENATPSWTDFKTQDPNETWNLRLEEEEEESSPLLPSCQ